MSTDAEIRELFGKHDVPLSKNDVWAVQGTPVVKHKALERLAAGLKIKFDEPRVLRSERDEAVMLVIGHLPTGTTEWSIGECVVNVNYKVTGKQAAYPYAMAEKRSKDRVILKLAGLHGTYSEDEADEFKEGRPNGNGNGGGQPDAFGDTIPAEKAHHLLDRLNAVNANIPKFCEYLKIPSIADLPASKYAAAEMAIRAKEKQAAGGGK